MLYQQFTSKQLGDGTLHRLWDIVSLSKTVRRVIDAVKCTFQFFLLLFTDFDEMIANTPPYARSGPRRPSRRPAEALREPSEGPSGLLRDAQHGPLV